MPEMNEKLARFTSTILAEASAEVDATEQEIAAYRETKLKQAAAEATAETSSFFNAEMSRIQVAAGREVSLRMLETKRTLALQREEVAQSVFAEVRERIGAFTQTPDYLACLKNSVRDILLKIGGYQSLKIYLRPADAAFVSELLGTAGQAQITFLEGSFHMGGLVVECPELNIRYDATFDTATAELDGQFAALFGLSLADI